MSRTSKALQALAESLAAAADDAGSEMAEELGKALREEASRRGWSSESQSAIVVNDDRVAILSPQSSVETGRPAIEAPPGHALRIRTPGGDVFRRSVGPQLPDPILKPTVDASTDRLVDAAERTIGAPLKR